MDEDILVRAVTIGASVFITLATVTAIMMYYNTAKIAVGEVGTGTNLEQNYREDIKEILYNRVVTGAEVRNILQYFFKNQEVNVTIDKYYAYHESGAQITVIPVSNSSGINFFESVTYTQIMKTMMPNQKFTLVTNGNVYTFTLIYP